MSFSHLSWQKTLANLITDPEILFKKIELDLSQKSNQLLLKNLQESALSFKLRVTESFAERIEKNNPNDPLLLQILPLKAEGLKKKGFSADPVQESRFNPVPGILHKYHGRALITLSGACAIHCRYCFRRHFPYKKNTPGFSALEKIFDYIAQHKTLTEIILSGGDPLSLPEKILNKFLQGLENIPHIKTLRIHSRIPIVLPERLDGRFIEWFKNISFKKVLVVHTNHPNELSPTVQYFIRRLKSAIPSLVLLNHTVLLKNVNNNAETLIKLSEKLFDTGILPYYLNILDKVEGAGHFYISIKKAKKILKTLQETLPGYLVPKLAREIPGEKHKTVLC